jgi:hypothetical protein
MGQALIAGQALLEAKAIVGHGGWAKWVDRNCVFSERTARVYMQVARNPKSADSADSLVEALETLRGGPYAHCHGDVEWYSPRSIVEAARTVLGRIDLDPASCDVANEVVKARRIFTVKDDGLRHPWRGRVFMNPPYSPNARCGRFIDKLVAHVRDESVSEAVVVLNNSTEVLWFKTLSTVATAICFPTGRLRFWKPGQTGAMPVGQSIVYAGRRPKKFQRAFRRFGHVWFA